MASGSRSRLSMRWGAGLLALALVSGCGGGGGTVSTPTPSPAPAPTPSPSPTPTPAAVFDTLEYRQTDGPAFHDAIPAWQAGATGKGVAIGIVDTGIDTGNPEFAGRISPASADVVANRGIDDVDGHGTMVALVAAAARDNSGILGIAWEATVMALRADSVGSCGSADGCTFFDSDIALGVDRAVQNGAKVINLSLGGDPPAPGLQAAITRAADAGVVVVVSAGNDADDPQSSIDPNNPDPFAIGLRQAGKGNVIIAGSVDINGQISSFSNRAGSEQNYYLMALGEQVCCVYENGQIKTTVENGQTFVYVVSGTSFSAPHIAGAVALLRQAFPNLTAVEVVDLLLRTARDAGVAATDAVYGRGILDIAAAFAPQGTMSLAGATQRLALFDVSIVTSSAMGDAGIGAGLQTVMLDSYRRAYSVNLGQNLRGANVSPKLARALIAPLRQASGGNGDLALAFSIDASSRAQALPWRGQLRLGPLDAHRAEVLAAQMVARLSPKMRLAFGYAQGADGLMAQVQGSRRPAFLVAGSPTDDMGFAKDTGFAFALRRDIGRWGLTVNGESGDALSVATMRHMSLASARPRQESYNRLGIAIDRRWGGFDASLGANWLSEGRTVLGARLHEAFGSRGADSLFLDAQAGWNFLRDWRLGAAWRQGYTKARASGLLTSGSRLVSNGWSLDVTRSSLFTPDDSLALRVSQPLRVQTGGLNFDLPVAYSYDTLETTRDIRRLTLSPRGREIATELSWRGRLWGGWATGSLFYRKDPGHYRDLRDDKGVGLSWNTDF